MNIWALTDSRVGNSKQTLALAKALGSYTEKKVSFSNISKLPNKLLGNSLLGTTIDASGAKPDLIISAGRKLARVALALKKEYSCKAIHIMNPGSALLSKFDHVIIPNHDEIKADNVINITGSLCAVGKMKAEEHATKQIAVLVGNLSAAESQKLVDIINANKALYMVTTSRRTEIDAVNIIENNIRQMHRLYKYGSTEKNPYDSFLAGADIIIVTGDSVNMITEAAHTGKPLYIVEVETKEKFGKFWQELYSTNIARKLESTLESWEYTPLNNLKYITEKIKLT